MGPARRGACSQPVRARVGSLREEGDRFVVASGDLRFEAENVVVAMATFQNPRVPPFAQELDPDIVQMHCAEYQNLPQLRDGGVLVGGAGNSGSEIALETVSRHSTWLSGESPGVVPFRIETLAARFPLLRLVRLLGHRVLTVRTPIGRKARPRFLSRGGPVVRVKRKDLTAAGVERVPRTVGVRDGLPMLEDGRVLEGANIIWCTGFGPDFSWIDLPVFGDEEEPKEPIHQRGIVASQPGLYFVGLFFLYAATSGLLTGVGRDAEHAVKHIASRSR